MVVKPQLTYDTYIFISLTAFGVWMSDDSGRNACRWHILIFLLVAHELWAKPHSLFWIDDACNYDCVGRYEWMRHSEQSRNNNNNNNKKSPQLMWTPIYIYIYINGELWWAGANPATTKHTHSNNQIACLAVARIATPMCMRGLRVANHSPL